MVRVRWIFVICALVLALSACQSEGGEVAQAATMVGTATVLPPIALSVVPSPVATLVATPTAVLPPPTPTLPSAFCPYWRGRSERASFVSTNMGETINYVVHLPPCYDQYPTTAFPTLYLLHGWPMNEQHWDSLGMDELADDWIGRGLSGPFIIVMPGVTDWEGRYVNSSGGAGSFEGMLVDELMPRVESAYRVLKTPEGRAIGGISRGGVWSLEIGMRHPELFMTLAGHSPALAVNNPPLSYDPFYLAQTGLPGQRVYLDAGDLDWSRGGAVELREVLLAAGADVTYEVHEGAHVDELWHGGLADYLAFYTAVWPADVAALPHLDASPEQTWLEGTPTTP